LGNRPKRFVFLLFHASGLAGAFDAARTAQARRKTGCAFCQNVL